MPQRKDDGSYPVPKDEALVASFEPKKWTGPWPIQLRHPTAFGHNYTQFRTDSAEIFISKSLTVPNILLLVPRQASGIRTVLRLEW